MKNNLLDRKQLIYPPEKLEMYRAFMTGYVKRINEATFNVPIGGIRIGLAKFSRLAQINLESRIITFSCYAIENVPERGRRYLVLHELAHVKEANHTKRFWQLVEKYEPDYRHIGRSLESAFKQNVIEIGRTDKVFNQASNKLFQSSKQHISESNVVYSGLEIEEDVLELLALHKKEDITPTFYDCDLGNFLDWTVE